MYFSAYHWKPIIHGYTAYPPLLSRRAAARGRAVPVRHRAAGARAASASTPSSCTTGGRWACDLARRLRDTGSAIPTTFHRLLQLAELDLFDRLPGAVAAGRIERLARFEGAPARLYQSTADEVYRAAPRSAAQPPRPSRAATASAIRRWRYRTKVGDPATRPRTATCPPPGGSRASCSATSSSRSRSTGRWPSPASSFRLRRDSAFPTRFRVAGRIPGRGWVELARLDEAHVLQLVDRLREDPQRAALGFDLGGRTLAGISLLVDEAGTSFEGWSLPEVEVWAPHDHRERPAPSRALTV